MSKLAGYIPLDITKIEKLLLDESIGHQLKIIFEKYKNDDRLFNFFNQDNYNMLSKIPWNNFRRALKLTDEIPGLEAKVNKVMRYIASVSVISKEVDGIMNRLDESSHDVDISSYREYYKNVKSELSKFSDELQNIKNPLVISEIKGIILNYTKNLQDLLRRIRPSTPEDESRVTSLTSMISRLSYDIESSESTKTAR